VCAAVLRDRRFGAVPAGGDQRRPEDEIEASFLTMNPPDHTRLRRLARPSFSPKAMAGYRGLIEQSVAGLLDRAAVRDTFDLIPAFASPLPITVITELLGVPEEDSDGFAEYGASLAGALDGIRSLRHAARLQADSDKLSRLFERLLELRRREPRDDIVSRLVAAEGDQVRPEEIMPLCVLLLIAGFETTVNLIGNAVLALLDHPDQWRALCEDPAGLAPKAVEETLRYDPPVQRTNRYALEAVELEGERVGKGQVVVTLIGAANRDPEVYERPGSFDIQREPGPEHLAFSSGIHYCVGQPLARLEATIALRMLAERMPGLTLAGAIRRRNTTTIRGPIQVPVTAGAARTPRGSAPAAPKCA
jgi:cytochrome P450